MEIDYRAKYEDLLKTHEILLRTENKRKYMRKYSIERYDLLKGTKKGERYYSSIPPKQRMSIEDYDDYKRRDRMKKRITRLIEGRSKGGMTIRCDCGKDIQTCVTNIDELPLFRNLIGNMCTLHNLNNTN